MRPSSTSTALHSPSGNGGKPALAESLRLSEEVFRAIFEQAGIGMALVDLEGHPTATNRSLRESLGYSEAELRKMTFTEFTHPDDVEADWELFQELVRGERPRYQMDKRFIRKDGETLHGRLTASMVRNPDGSPRYAVGMVEDVTELKRTAEERKRLRARLAAAQEDERRRIAEDLHDDPVQKLTAIDIRLGTMVRMTEDERQRERLAALQSAVSDIVRRLRFLMFDLRPPGLEQDGLAQTIRQHLGRQSEDTGWTWQVEDGVGEDVPAGTQAVAYRIAHEAIANARKHASASKVVVRIDADGKRLQVSVRDDGVGFDPSSAPDDRDGHLGLAGMRERAELHEGGCDVESAPGRGTTVRFWLPVDQG